MFWCSVHGEKTLARGVATARKSDNTANDYAKTMIIRHAKGPKNVSKDARSHEKGV